MEGEKDCRNENTMIGRREKGKEENGAKAGGKERKGKETDTLRRK